MVEIAAITNNMTILDAGCGFGGTISYLNDHFENLNLIGVNIDGAQINRASQEITPKSQNRINFIEANACNIPVEIKECDRILAVECIFAFPSRLEFFQQAQRLLKPGGKLTICDFIPVNWFAGIWQFSEKTFNPLIAKTYGTAKKDNPVFSFISQSQYQDLAAKTGFKLTKIVDITPNTLPTYPVVNRLMKEANSQGIIANTTEGLALISRLGWMGYLILDFVKK
jgi:MPBQ/MSBQ methyltransferase